MLKNIPLFAGLEDAELALLSRKAVARTFPKNAYIINEGDRSDTLYVMVSGKVKAFLRDEHGKEVILSFQGPGEYFGELALLDDEPRSASIVTVEPTTVNVVSKADLMKCISESPELAFRLIRDLSHRLRVLTENVRSLALMDVYGRVARTLLDLAKPDDGKMVIQEKLTHQDIANMVGSSREMVTRILKDLTTGGYISNEGRHIVVREKLPPAW
ncbi:MAG: CRP/FNR family transcriptional regulator cyclic AMP receptor protein [Gammaproteobacteria bacterium]|nr:MAG: CRP/FNR family transcriptional regulator cyclic AMP receptor protein [Gammaproteobacteria bacterium]TND04331.1 MAG: CRP/FNR family transcriptional regulator, cyclic AMP receptor protein [Gammaproteobacteria bacterium]